MLLEIDNYKIRYLNSVKRILDNNSKQIELYKNGKTNMFDFFVGQVMKESKGRANPGMVNQLLQKFLND